VFRQQVGSIASSRRIVRARLPRVIGTGKGPRLRLSRRASSSRLVPQRKRPPSIEIVEALELPRKSAQIGEDPSAERVAAVVCPADGGRRDAEQLRDGLEVTVAWGDVDIAEASTCQETVQAERREAEEVIRLFVQRPDKWHR
jgi:hypothetical protein